jgi:hypothetical protein
MQPPNKIIEQVYLISMARRSMSITLPIILQSFFITQEKESWRKLSPKAYRARRWKCGTKGEREWKIK